MQPTAIYLSTSLFNYTEEELPAKLQAMHEQKQRVHLIDVDGSVIAKNSLNRKNYPWVNPQKSPTQWTTIEDLWKNRYRPQTRRECVFYALDLLGDQTSLKTLLNYARGFYDEAIDEETHPLKVHQLHFWQNISSKYGIDLFSVESYDEFYKKYHHTIYRSTLSLNAFDKLWNDWAYIWNCHLMRKHHCMIYRQEWRRHHGSNHDCRTYRGQPDRDMMKAA